MMTPQQVEIIRGLKGFSSTSLSGITIYNDAGQRVGCLKPIDIDLAQDNSVIESLRLWRQKFMRFFLTQFQTTSERTKSWLSQVVIPDDSRILFLILDDTDKAVGNFGVCNIASESAELDNLIRGEKGGDAKLIYYAEIALLHWVYTTIDVPNVYLYVFSNNRPTLALHESIGFNEVESIALFKSEMDGEIHYTSDGKGKLENFTLKKMALSAIHFIDNHPWASK